MAGLNVSVDTAAPTELIANKDADTNSQADSPQGGDDGGSASVLRRLLEDMATSEEGARDAETLRKWIRSRVEESIREDLNMTDSEGSTLLHVAAREGLTEAVKRLLAADAKLDAQDRFGNTALLRACWRGHMHIVDNLLKNGANAELLDEDGWSPLFMATRRGNRQMTELLLAERKWNLDLKEKLRDMTPLHAAVLAGNREIVRLLRGNGARLDLRDENGWTPLMAAIVYQDKDTMFELITRQRNEDTQLETEDHKGRTPLLRAAEDSFWDGVRLLVEAGARCDKSELAETIETDSPSFMTRKEDTALHYAIRRNNFQMAKFLLEYGANVNARDQRGKQPLHLASSLGHKAILRLLLGNRYCNHLNMKDDDGMTPLHLASYAGESDGYETSEVETNSQTHERRTSDIISGNGRYNEVVRLLLEKRADTKAVTKDGQTAMELAFAFGHDNRGEAILDAFAEASGGAHDTLLWAASNTGRHWIAISLMERQFKASGSLCAETSRDWTAIEWATYSEDPRALWLLIASSPQVKETREALKSASAIVERSDNQAERSSTNSGDQHLDQANDTRKRKISAVRQEMQEIINNPPIGLIYTDNPTYSLPRYDDRFSSLENYAATIVQFHETEGRVDRIMRHRTIKETIYGQGPAGIMNRVVEKLRESAYLHLTGLKENAVVQRQDFMDSKPTFTWIHLPATNMVWMDHLLQRLMRDDDHSSSHFNQAESFFKDSWVEIPDKVSSSRMMRPRFVSRDMGGNGHQKKAADMIYKSKSYHEGWRAREKEERNDSKKQKWAAENEPSEQKQGQNPDEEATAAASIAATALYMPYLSYSFECSGGNNDWALESAAGDLEIEQVKEREHAKRLIRARETYHKLLDEYCHKVIHGSSTLDESYYHFGEPESTEEKTRRNMSQVTTDMWKKGEGLGSYWLLVRVNQLWIWTINDKWLISASSHPIDDRDHELLNGIVERLEKKKGSGDNSQPVSTAEMTKMIVDYCIGSYDRKPKTYDDNERPEDCNLAYVSSIRQTFSMSINSIVTDEMKLHEDLSDLTDKLRDSMDQRKENVKSIEKKLADATMEAKRLSSKVKDILDELNILKTTVQYQQDVQKAMSKTYAQNANGSQDLLEMDLTTTYIINDIKKLESVAERVHAEAKLSVEHAEIATRQGEKLMVFTVTTIIFVPLSFMTSLFAVDVASFQQAPTWALPVIFSVASAFVIPAFFYAFAGNLKLTSYLRELAKVPNRVRDNDEAIKLGTLFPRPSGASSLQGLSRNPAGSLRARKPAKSTVDVEKGLGNSGG